MSRLVVTKTSQVDLTVQSLYQDLERRLEAAPRGNCPLDLTSSFLKLCLSQSCGKCVPCRIGLRQMAALLDKILEGQGSQKDLETLKSTALAVRDSADCAIGFEGAAFVLNGLSAFGDDYQAHLSSGRCTEKFRSVPCVHLCPAHVDIPGYIACVKAGRYADAVRIIRKDNPFPSACDLICEHPCEAGCRRKMIDDSVNIRGLKRFAVEHAGEVPAPPCAPATGKKIAVVGGGPSGLTAAYFLSLMGHQVTVFERRKRLGGMLRYGIPIYRLPDQQLDDDIRVILSTGIEVRTETSIGTDVTMDQLKQNYDSVYLSIGAHAGNLMGIENENSEGVLSAVKLLGDIGDGIPYDFTGKRVVVVGGGNVAMDAVRTAIRLHADSVTCVYRRRVADMTALPEEVRGAMAEGCVMEEMKSPVRVEAEQGKVTGLVVQPQIIGAIEHGRPAPRNAAAPEERIPCEIIIGAVGQSIETDYLEQQGVPVKRRKLVTTDSGAIATMDGVFAGGDCVFGPATVIKAIDAGKVAAAEIDSYLGFHHEIRLETEIPPVGISYDKASRAEMRERPSSERKNDFDLMEIGLTEQEARQECARCLRCDHYGMGALREGRIAKW